MSISRRQKKIGGSILAVAALVIATDMGFASHAEYKLSEHIQETAQLEMTPYVAIGGKAYLSSFVTGKWSSVTSRIRDVEVPDFGLVSLEYGASNVKIPASAVLSGNFPESPTKQYFTKLSLDGVSLGNKLGLTDLSIQSLKDSSPPPAAGRPRLSSRPRQPDGREKPRLRRSCALSAATWSLRRWRLFLRPRPQRILKATSNLSCLRLIRSTSWTPSL